MSKRPSTFEKNMAKANDIIYKAILKTKQTGDKAEDQEQNNAENSANNDKPQKSSIEKGKPPSSQGKPKATKLELQTQQEDQKSEINKSKVSNRPSVKPQQQLAKKPPTTSQQQQENAVSKQVSQHESVQEKQQQGKLTELSLKEFKNLRKANGITTILETHKYDVIQQAIEKIVLNGCKTTEGEQAEQQAQDSEGIPQQAEKALDNFIYKDDEFPADLVSVAKQKEKLSSSMQIIYTQIKFFRTNEVAESALDLRFFDEKNQKIFYLNSIIQGKLANSPFLNALAMVCSSNILFDFLRCYEEQQDIFLDDYQKKGIYCFRFFKNKYQKYTVLLDDFLPCVILSNKKPVPVGARCSYENEFWVSLIEKAYAKLHGDYNRLESISLREAINDLTGLEPEFIYFGGSKDNLKQDNFLNTLKILQVNKSIVAFMRTGGPIKGYNSSATYSPIANRTLEDRVYIFSQCSIENKTITFKNPWWGSSNIKAVNSKEAEKEVTVGAEEFQSLFNTMIVLKDFADEWRGLRYEVQLNPSNGLPSTNNQTWINNPQISFDLNIKDDAGPARFSIQLQDIKGIHNTKNVDLVLGFLMFSLSDKERKIKNMNLQQLITNAKSGWTVFDDKFAHAYCQLKRGRYVIIPFTNIKGEGGVYLNLELFFNCKESNIVFLEGGSSDKVLESCLGESISSLAIQTFRKLRDQVRNEYFQNFSVAAIDNAEILSQPTDILVPNNIKNFVIANMNQLSQIIKQEYSKKVGKFYSEIKVYDPLLDNYVDNLETEILLGTYVDEEEEKLSNLQKYLSQPVDQQIINKLQAEEEGIYDFSFFGLSDDGLSAILEILVSEPQLLNLNFSGNNITDDGIIELSYQLEKSHHLEIQSIDLSSNKIGKKGADAILTMVTRLRNITNLKVEDNSEFPSDIVQKINLYINQRKKIDQQ